MRTYIPLNALRAFEAAARHLSFTRAAAELCVTPTAISHQVRTLEEFLHTPLFQRKSGKLILMPAASNALLELSEGFNKLESALLAFNRRGRQRKLSVAASPSVASLWLMPKLNRFFATAPDVELSLCTVTGQSDFSDGPFDVAICSTVATMLDAAAGVPGTKGLMLTFDDFVEGIDNFGKHIQPLMQCRADRQVPAA